MSAGWIKVKQIMKLEVHAVDGMMSTLLSY